MTRPEALFPLFADLETLEGVGPKTAQAFGALGVTGLWMRLFPDLAARDKLT